MTDIIGKSKTKSTNLARKLTINKVDVYHKPEIADAFNDFFTNIGQKLASQIPKSSKIFETYINKVNVKMESKSSSINELKDAFFSLKINKRSGVDKVSFNIIKKCFGVLYERFMVKPQPSDIRVHTSDIRMAYEYIRVTYK